MTPYRLIQLDDRVEHKNGIRGRVCGMGPSFWITVHFDNETDAYDRSNWRRVEYDDLTVVGREIRLSARDVESMRDAFGREDFNAGACVWSILEKRGPRG